MAQLRSRAEICHCLARRVHVFGGCCPSQSCSQAGGRAAGPTTGAEVCGAGGCGPAPHGYSDFDRQEYEFHIYIAARMRKKIDQKYQKDQYFIKEDRFIDCLD